MTLNTAKSPSQRQLRVAEQIRHTLARVFERQEVRNPDLTDTTITITEVRMSADLKRAIIYFYPLGEKPNLTNVTQAMSASRSFLRRRVGQDLRLKYVPDLDLRLDRSFDEAARINRLFQDPKVRRDLQSTPSAVQPLCDE